jgi:DNA-binding LacI/PurR family transcriptional regulator
MASSSPRRSSSQRSNSKVIQVLRDRILAGHYQPGDWLPTERVLAEDLDVDRRVIRMAINALVQDGLAHRRPHCRPIVGPDPGEPARPAVQPVAAPASASDFIALIMWPGGGPLEPEGTSQQRIFWGMNYALANKGYHAVFLGLGHIGEEEETAAREAEHLRYVVERGFAGIVFYPYAFRSNQALIQEVSRKIPLVMLDRRIMTVETDFVGIDNRQATFDATMHLIAQGHRRIAFVTKCEQVHPVQERIQGYIAAVRRANVAEIVLTIPSRDREEPWTVTDTIFRLPKGERPTAAAVFNDYATVDLMRRLQTMGLDVPRDVALVGFDNIVPTLPNGVGLTTVAQPYEEIGKSAVDLLLRRMKDFTAPLKSIELPAELVVRESSIAPPSAP